MKDVYWEHQPIAPTAMKKTGPNGIAATIEKRIARMVEKSIHVQSYKADLPKNSKPTVEELHETIDNFARKSAAMAAGFSLIPGPLGVFALYKELQSVLQTQIDLVAYLTLRMHKREQVTTDLVLSMLATALGNVGISLLTVQGGKVILRRLSTELAETTAKRIGARIAQKSGYHFAAKWIPLAGSGLLYLHTLHTTRQLGRRALKLLDRGIIIETEAV